VHRWEETDDVFQQVLLRLDRLLSEVPVPTLEDFLRLTTTLIRRELIGLARHYAGVRNVACNHATPPGADRRLPDGEDPSTDPAQLLWWSEFHQRIGSLPDEDRQVFDLLWYQGLTHEEAAQMLQTSDRTVRRRWQSARLCLAEALGDDLPF